MRKCEDKGFDCRGPVMNDIDPVTTLPVMLCEHHLDVMYADSQDDERYLIAGVRDDTPEGGWADEFNYEDWAKLNQPEV